MNCRFYQPAYDTLNKKICSRNCAPRVESPKKYCKKCSFEKNSTVKWKRVYIIHIQSTRFCTWNAFLPIGSDIRLSKFVDHAETLTRRRFCGWSGKSSICEDWGLEEVAAVEHLLVPGMIGMAVEVLATASNSKYSAFVSFVAS